MEIVILSIFAVITLFLTFVLIKNRINFYFKNGWIASLVTIIIMIIGFVLIYVSKM